MLQAHISNTLKHPQRLLFRVQQEIKPILKKQILLFCALTLHHIFI